MIDGQHRLWAIVISAVTVRTRVFFNEPLESMRVVDTGLARSNFDVLHLAGDAGDMTTSHLATLRSTIWSGAVPVSVALMSIAWFLVNSCAYFSRQPSKHPYRPVPRSLLRRMRYFLSTSRTASGSLQCGAS